MLGVVESLLSDYCDIARVSKEQGDELVLEDIRFKEDFVRLLSVDTNVVSVRAQAVRVVCSSKRTGGYQLEVDVKGVHFCLAEVACSTMIALPTSDLAACRSLHMSGLGSTRGS